MYSVFGSAITLGPYLELHPLNAVLTRHSMDSAEDNMSRVIKTIEIEGKPAAALFDTGAFHSYVLRQYLEGIPHRSVPVSSPYEVSLGGEPFVVHEHAVVNGKIEGLDFVTMVVPRDSLGKVDGQELDAIIGAITMKHWEITVNPKDGSLGLEGLRRREFTDY